MVHIGFKEQFAQAVEDGTKRQTIRQANCSHQKTEEGTRCYGPTWNGVSDNCILDCERYTHRIKAGDTLQLYTGLRQRKYCKLESPCLAKHIDLKCLDLEKPCKHRGAKLLKTATCTESFPIKFEDLTRKIAELDGFKMPDTKGTIGMYYKAFPEEQLKDFLIKTYDAKDGMVFQVVRW